ncbi:VOC family protein [Guyparkeria hydrothermalis]|uniref:VOC family protein n=1 Tax=Guyparkeria hydrothermalis TaxID=923 RepID=UPI00202294BF|nr:VOC family protein [Guyparkeria hydrothermalis]MCL7743410.1 VOC family protein [Guyparkeria hydrothermalis]
MEQRVSVITLGVADLARSRGFYEQGMGWTVGDSAEQVVFFQLNGTVLALYPREALARDALGEDAGIPAAGNGFSGITLAHNVRSPAAVDEVLAQAKAAGGRIVKLGEKAFWGGYSGYFADPDGHLWEVAYNPFWTLDPDGTVWLDVELGDQS